MIWTPVSLPSSALLSLFFLPPFVAVAPSSLEDIHSLKIGAAMRIGPCFNAFSSFPMQRPNQLPHTIDNKLDPDLFPEISPRHRQEQKCGLLVPGILREER